ncbi:acyl-CoA thioesterase/bile acid-CoA:amino acid N-acyltransferase family protein [Pandoraea anhela]|uniref:Palmitoyl-CoA hydrolase n=1 Tax=Pandoraea anhela TaxID=2508295 RepID=A0A5E4SYU2_9BURK|nr:acyl-CoA thioesterase/bile acid-CoA:amino acid N-acyltransferase family protein [Pandoraea anhela]VVD80817.1 palmitoyl-CoA hydrolase [Pandoraea anhela]
MTSSHVSSTGSSSASSSIGSPEASLGATCSTALILTATPADALIDVPRHLVVRGAVPGAHVTLAARTARAGGVVWHAQATFVADADGVVDVSRDAPVSGSYRGVSAMGLIWSQVPEDGKSRDVFPQPVLAPLVTTVVAQVVDEDGLPASSSDRDRTSSPTSVSDAPSGHGVASSRVVASERSLVSSTTGSATDAPLRQGPAWASASASASASEQMLTSRSTASTTDAPPKHGTASAPVATSVSFTQRLVAEGVTRRDVREDGLVGTLYLPPGEGPYPAVMILNGSGGGINEPRAALYASHGYAAFALGYFKGPGLPDYISNTALEYFAKGMDWLRRTVRPAHDFVALSGQSRGGELVLLLGATFPDAVSAIIGYVPSALIHSAQNACDPAIGREGPTWLLDGKPLPHIWENNRTASWAPFDEGPPPHRHASAMLTALDDAAAVERARIPVEKIRGPVMLLSAQDDGSWPSSLYSRMVTERLAAHAHPYAVEHLDFDRAGHAIVFPYVPTTQLVYAHPVSGKISTGGGVPDANAIADERSWVAVQAFLAQAVAERAQSQGQS